MSAKSSLFAWRVFCGCGRADGVVDAVISLRFSGGPLDGHTDQGDALPDEYRLVGGVYRRVRTHRRASSPDHVVATYRWYSDDSQPRLTPAELVSMW